MPGRVGKAFALTALLGTFSAGGGAQTAIAVTATDENGKTTEHGGPEGGPFDADPDPTGDPDPGPDPPPGSDPAPAPEPAPGAGDSGEGGVQPGPDDDPTEDPTFEDPDGEGDPTSPVADTPPAQSGEPAPTAPSTAPSSPPPSPPAPADSPANPAGSPEEAKHQQRKRPERQSKRLRGRVEPAPAYEGPGLDRDENTIAAPVASPPEPMTRSAQALPPATRSAQAPPPQAGANSYTIASGDSLWSIADRLAGPNASAAEVAHVVAEIWELNSRRIASGSPDQIEPGVKLALPAVRH